MGAAGSAQLGSGPAFDHWRLVAGRWGRTMALGAGRIGLRIFVGVLELLGVTKWVYHLPFLGVWEQVQIF